MKKFIYLCGMMLLSLNIMAQIDLNDRNWDWNHAFEDDFNTNRSWNPNNWFSLPDEDWKAYYVHITHGSEHQIYQYDNCIFDVTNGIMRFVSEYDFYDSIPTHNYALPSNYGGYPNALNSNDGLFFFSGETYVRSQKFKYGYFEIRCKIPTHKGAFPAFWLHGSSSNPLDPYYEEIDVFEYSWWITTPFGPNPNAPGTGSKRCFSTGIYQNLTGLSPDHITEHFANQYPIIPNTSTDLDDWHIFGCEWMPDHVFWYFDGNLVNSYYNKEHIPCHGLNLIANYAIDGCAMNHNTGLPIWFGSDEMDVDYINVYQLIWDCDTDETITCQSDLDSFEYGVKKSVSITSTIDEPIINNTDKVTFRVDDFFEITGPFQVSNGAEFTVIMQDCPN